MKLPFIEATTAALCHLWAAALFVVYKYVAMHASNMFNVYLQKVSHADVVFTTTTGRSSMVYGGNHAQHVYNPVC